MSVCVFFLGNYRWKRAIHSYTNEPSSIVFWYFVTFSSKTRCLSAKLDTLTSKQLGVCPKNVVVLSVTKPFFDVFYGPKHTHSYTHFNSQIGFCVQNPFELRIAVCVWVYVFLVYECMGACPGGWGGTPATPKKPFFDPSPKHTLKVASGSHLEPLFGSRRPRVLFRVFRVLFYTELVYRKIVVFFSFVCVCVCVCVWVPGRATHFDTHTFRTKFGHLHFSSIFTEGRYNHFWKQALFETAWGS